MKKGKIKAATHQLILDILKVLPCLTVRDIVIKVNLLRGGVNPVTKRQVEHALLVLRKVERENPGTYGSTIPPAPCGPNEEGEMRFNEAFSDPNLNYYAGTEKMNTFRDGARMRLMEEVAKLGNVDYAMLILRGSPGMSDAENLQIDRMRRFFATSKDLMLDLIDKLKR